ncbi:unknown function [Ochrobactrum phage vB_OspP_OH]|uniref:Uncharacterized protein n=1 Tax=Ochrobactrum phage vB_OspP_OH TaxID=2712957 RepID=A0A6G6XY84_9CAUD|nr:unknown function [Ochrobactrum phage vB_OspP_OH]QIG66070.1 hypothetical protein phiOH_p14 [Ochrobactrum phage vB_OspP_OH]
MKQVDSKIIERIKKLLALANNNPNEAEAAAAMAKAQELLEAYNLDAAVVGARDNARKDTKKKGGLYSWQRKLWDAVAKLNFCYYVSIKGLARGSSYEHRLIGSHANVVATEMMAQYLQDTVERLAQKWAKDNAYKSVFVREAIAYREGMVLRLSTKLNERREAIVSEARKKEQERKRDEARADIVTGNELTILDVISSEADFNNDYLNGWEMGTTARNRVEREARQKAWEEEYWAKENAKSPEQKAREKAELDAWYEEYQKKQARKEARRKNTQPRERKMTAEEERASLGSFREGYSDGANINIDQQVDKENREKLQQV